MTESDDEMFEEFLVPPHVGEAAPKFTALQSYHQEEFKKISLSDYDGKWLVLFFYPRDFTFICPTEIQEFGKYHEEFKALGCEVLGASTDSEYVHKAWYETDARLIGTPFPIIADTTQELAEAYDVLDVDGSAQRGTFIIDPKGIVRYILISADSVGRNVKEIVRVVQALQTGERCPAAWEKGGATLGKAE